MINRFDTEIRVLTLVKGEERFVLIFNKSDRAKAIKRLGVMAADKKLSFTWYDAAVLAQKVRSA